MTKKDLPSMASLQPAMVLCPASALSCRDSGIAAGSEATRHPLCPYGNLDLPDCSAKEPAAAVGFQAASLSVDACSPSAEYSVLGDSPVRDTLWLCCESELLHHCSCQTTGCALPCPARVVVETMTNAHPEPYLAGHVDHGASSGRCNQTALWLCSRP